MDDLWSKHISPIGEWIEKIVHSFASTKKKISLRWQKLLKRKAKRLLNILIDEKCVSHSQNAFGGEGKKTRRAHIVKSLVVVGFNLNKIRALLGKGQCENWAHSLSIVCSSNKTPIFFLYGVCAVCVYLICLHWNNLCNRQARERLQWEKASRREKEGADGLDDVQCVFFIRMDSHDLSFSHRKNDIRHRGKRNGRECIISIGGMVCLCADQER